MRICKVIKEGTKKEYTYLTDTDVSVGDNVVAEFGKSDTVLIVTEVGDMAQEEYDALGYPLKSIKGFAEEIEVEPSSTIDIKITEETLPVIAINFDEIKTHLSTTLVKYKNLVVTEQSLRSAKATQKELAGIRVKIDNYRKDKKKVLSEPIVAFENQCKELIGLIENVEKPIKECISTFDDSKKSEKRNRALELILEVGKATGLNEKHLPKLTVIDKYCNLTAKDSDVKSDLETRAFALKVEQDKEAELLEIIKATIDAENKKNTQKMAIDDFQNLINAGAATSIILDEVRKKSQMIYNAEHPVQKEEFKEDLKPITEPIPEPMPAKDVFKPLEAPQLYSVEYKITGTQEQLLKVSQFLKINEFVYAVENQQELWS